MRALSVQQPWAWLIANGHKDIENRDWPTRVRGQVLVHAGLKLDKASLDQLRYDHPEIPFPTVFERGGVVGVMTIVDCVTDSASPWFCGRYGFVLKDARPLKFRPFKGQLGFFEVP